MMTLLSDQLASKIVDPVRLRQMRAHLIEHTTKLMGKKGYHATSVQEIAEACGWPQGTLYLYIRSKQELLFLVMDAVAHEVWDPLVELPGENTARATLDKAVDSLFRRIHRRQSEMRLFYREGPTLTNEQYKSIVERENAARIRLTQIIDWGVQDGEFSSADGYLIGFNLTFAAQLWAMKSALRQQLTIKEYLARQRQLLLAPLYRTSGLATATSHASDSEQPHAGASPVLNAEFGASPRSPALTS